MKTAHRIYFQTAAQMSQVADDGVDLVVTSPPYPMISMWDEIFSKTNPDVENALAAGDGQTAFDLMHGVLDPVWDEIYRVVRPGGFICINVGDAVRTAGDRFSLYPNHVRIMEAFVKRGANPLPLILWRKQTNAPNKYMGSGMLPAGAYVTLEHEYILVFRKGSKRAFTTPQKQFERRQSAFFWEERNQWFSDIWFELKGIRQQLAGDQVRKRSGAFPFELPYRLIQMYSLKADIVLDPFAGTGTTMCAAMAGGRNSIGFEIDPGFSRIIEQRAASLKSFANEFIQSRMDRHLSYAAEREATRGPMKYLNAAYGIPVMTRQEIDLVIDKVESVRKSGEEGGFEVKYEKGSQYIEEPDRECRKDELRADSVPVQQNLFCAQDAAGGIPGGFEAAGKRSR